MKKFCKDCGKELKNYRSERCQSCAKKGKKNPMHKNAKKTRTCACGCGKKFKRYGRRDKKTTFFFKNYQHFKKWLQNSCNVFTWQGGVSKEGYSFKFTPRLKLKIRKRDNYTCQGENCKMTEKKHIIKYNKSLHIHHIDYNKKNCKEDNLITLCKSCNSIVNFNRKYWQEYFGGN